MKRIIIIAYLIFLAAINANSARVITNLDIARWYLDSDLVLICSVCKIDTLLLSHYDSLTYDSILLTYDIIQEIYYVDTDSIIKSTTFQHDKIDSIYSQDFSINYTKTKQSDSVLYTVNHSGDTIGADILGIITMFGTDFSDNSYFRLEMGKKHLVILSLTPNGYVIDYESELSQSLFELIKEVNDKGQDYFDDFFNLD